MPKPAAEGLDPLLVQFMEWTQENQRHKGEQTLASLGDEIGASRFAAEVEAEPPWTTEQLDIIQTQLDLLISRFDESTRLDEFV